MKYLTQLLKLALLALVVWLLTRHLNYADLKNALRQFSALTVLSVVACVFLRFIVYVWRVHYSAKIVGIELKFISLLRWEFEMLFIELAFPVVPDVEDMLRVAYWQKLKPGMSKIFSALLFSRIAGLTTIAFLLPFCYEVISEQTGWHHNLPKYFLWIAPVFFLFLSLAQNKLLLVLASWSSQRRFIPASVAELFSRMAQIDFTAKQYLIACAIGFAQHVFLSGGLYLLAHSNVAQITYWQFFVLSPVPILTFTLPLSPQSLGLPEAVMVWLLPYFGLSHEAALAVGIVHFLCYITLIFTGGILTLADSQNKLRDIKSMVAGIKNRNYSFLKSS